MCSADSATKICADQLIGDKSFGDEFVCKICLVHVVGCGPQLTKCSHLFCGDCLQQWFNAHPSNQTWAQRAKTGGAVPCPVCKTSLRKETDIYPIEEHGNPNSSFMWKMIQGLQIKCTAKGGCCTWKGEIGSYHEHLQCGRCGEVEPEDTTSLEETQSSIAFDDELTKEVPSSPSTNSTNIEALAWEELSSNFSLDECCIEGEEGQDLSAQEPSCFEASVKEDFIPLITGSTDDRAMETTSNPEDAKAIGDSDSAPASKTAMQSGMSPPKAPKNSKGSKKKQRNAKHVVAGCAQNTGMCMTPDVVRAYQMQAQAASYQIAYAQQYMMAMRTFQMQQYYQQAQMATGSM